MIDKLPEAFLNIMKQQLGDTFNDFLASYEEEPVQGLRVNTNKISVAEFIEKFPFDLTKVPWTEDGFYYKSEDPVTKHPYFYAGLYYIQEPSAMAPVNALNPKRGSVCLDLCAAPGGKTLQIANKIGRDGIVVSNDISDKRIKAIIHNVEKYGVTNAIILNNNHIEVAESFKGVFDFILIDAPCSGEGMFRRNAKAISAWQTYEVDYYAKMQREILKVLPILAHNDSEIAYSTCTFNRGEDEENIAFVLKTMPEIEMKSIDLRGAETTDNTARLWPHLVKGEGHFIGTFKANNYTNTNIKLNDYIFNDPPEPLKLFMNQYMKTPLRGYFEVVKDKVYLRPNRVLELNKLNVVRCGWLLGEIKGKHFKPYQSFAMGIKSSDFKQLLDLDSNSIEVIKYLKGETLHTDKETSGYHLVTTDGYPLGFCKIFDGVVKNMLAPAWRLMT